MNAEEDGQSTFLRVDEFNETSGQVEGLDLSQQQRGDEPWLADPDELRDAPNEPNGDTADTGQPSGQRGPARPNLRTDQWAPAPQQPPPPAPPQAAPEDVDVPTDSLSLAQLRRIVQDMPRKEATPYAFEYSDSSSFEEEIEEIFDYTAEEGKSLVSMPQAHAGRWREFREQTASEERTETLPGSWSEVDFEVKEAFLISLKSRLNQVVCAPNQEDIQSLTYIALGCWQETAGRPPAESPSQKGPDNNFEEQVNSAYQGSEDQVQAIKANVALILQHVGFGSIFEVFKTICLQLVPGNSANDQDMNGHPPSPNATYDQTITRCVMILLYLLIDCTRRRLISSSNASGVHYEAMGADVVHFLSGILADMRWNDSSTLSLLKILPIYWKAILITFGGLTDVEIIHRKLNEEAQSGGVTPGPRITASPLDYHLFRQEIISKYPAFNPPQPLFAFEPENTSMMPPLQEHGALDRISDGVGPASVNGNGSSIIHQPVHIATPAPSPPPSPAGPGGKGIKKQNYQTNQLFPFLYPPLDDASNQIGGRGGTELQDLLVGRKWEGSDIPTSILEAADIFASRMRATRAMKQLWEERVRFIKYERGYLTESSKKNKEGQDGEDEEQAEEMTDPTVDILDKDQKRRLAAVEKFYAEELPRLQSIVIVLLKILLQTVTTLVTQPNMPGGLQSGFESPEQHPQDRSQANGDEAEANQRPFLSANEWTNSVRSQEIMGKQVSGILILLLKWFKLSHILKFEYLTQLLLDSNYVQLILKLFTHQELERVVNNKVEMKNANFFAFCRYNATSSRKNSRPAPEETLPPTISPTDAATQQPPDQQQEPTTSIPIMPDHDPNVPMPETAPPAEVDELGYSTTEAGTGGIAPAPITTFSWRAFFSAINHLRILQKIVKNKPHRQLLMVQYKYSNILKKSLKVPQPDVRLYTLKIIKGQVPYCHRKWRQSNMRIITAIYLHCKPELRDDWLAGLTLEEEMGEAMPQEQALRSLTYWYNLRRYPKAVTDDAEKARGLLEEEQDFFVRELETMEALLGEQVGDGSAGEVDPLEVGGEAQWTREEREAFLARTREMVEQGPQPTQRELGTEEYAERLDQMYRATTGERRVW